MNPQVRFISLVNLIMDREVVCELLQGDFTAPRLAQEFQKIVNDTPERKKMLQDYTELQQIMGKGGTSEKVAASIKSMFRDL